MVRLNSAASTFRWEGKYYPTAGARNEDSRLYFDSTGTGNVELGARQYFEIDRLSA
jgi:hypothetical protein